MVGKEKKNAVVSLHQVHKDLSECTDQSSQLNAMWVTIFIGKSDFTSGSQSVASLLSSTSSVDTRHSAQAICVTVWGRVTHRKPRRRSHTPLIAVIALDCALVTRSAITPDNCINKTIFLPLPLCHSLQLPSALLHQFTAFPGTLSSNESQVSVWSLFPVSLCTLPSSSVPFLIFSGSISLPPSSQTVVPCCWSRQQGCDIITMADK